MGLCTQTFPVYKGSRFTSLKEKGWEKSTLKKASTFLKELKNRSHIFCKTLKTKDNTLPFQLPKSALKHQPKAAGTDSPDVLL